MSQRHNRRKSVSSVQIGQPSARADARTGQSSGSREPIRLFRFRPMFTVDVSTDRIDQTDDCIQEAKRLCRIPAAPDDKFGQVFPRFRQGQFRDKERYAVGVVFEDSPDPNAQYRANQDVGIEHECSI